MELVNKMEQEKRIANRFYIIKNLTKYIEESVYYRSFAEEISSSNPQVIYNLNLNEGKIKVE